MQSFTPSEETSGSGDIPSLPNAPSNEDDSNVSDIGSDDLTELLSPLSSLTDDLERSYQTGQILPYRQGVESFKRFCEDNFDTLNNSSLEFQGEQDASKRTIDLDICYAAKYDHDVVILEDNNGIIVQMPTDETLAPLVQHIASPQFDLLVSFRVRAYAARKVIGLPLVISEGDLIHTTSVLLNSTLALSARCDCGIIRAGMPIIDMETSVSAAFFFRLVYMAAILLPCGCETDQRLTEEEERDNWYAALCILLSYVVDLYLTLPRTAGFLNARYENIHVQFEDMRLKCNVQDANVSSLRSAALLVTKVCNKYADMEDDDDDNSSDSSVAEPYVLTDRDGIIERAVHITCADGPNTAIGWLCFNKLSNESAENLSIGGQNAELRRALLYMDLKGIDSLCGKTKEELQLARVPIVHNIVAKMQAALHAAGSASGVSMIREPMLFKRLEVQLLPRKRLESIRFHTQNEITHNYKGYVRTIAVTKQGAVLAFRKRTKLIRRFLQGVKSLSVLGNGMSWDFSELQGDSFVGDAEIVNDALQWKFGPEVFHFILSKIMTGRIRVNRRSPAASYAPRSSKDDVGVMIWTLLDNRLWEEQTFIVSKDKNKKRLELYWLPAEGMNYFMVHKKKDGLYRMEETSSTIGPRVFRCAALFADTVE